MFEIYESSAFKKDRRRESKSPRHKDLDQRIVEVLVMIYKDGLLPPKFKLHKLKGQYSEYLECHVRPDLLMIFRLDKNSVFLYRLGSHAELFR